MMTQANIRDTEKTGVQQLDDENGNADVCVTFD